MSEQPVLPDDILASLPSLVHADVTVFESPIAALHLKISQLRQHVADVQAQVRQYFGNSSQPVSADPPDAPPWAKRVPAGRRRGGQPGHLRRARLQLALTAIAPIVEHRPSECPRCTLPLPLNRPPVSTPQVIQVWECSPAQPEVTAHRAFSVRCPHCQVLLPASALPERPFGPRLTAFGGLLHGRYRLGMRETAVVEDDLFSVPLRASNVATLCQDVSAAVAAPYDDASPLPDLPQCQPIWLAPPPLTRGNGVRP